MTSKLEVFDRERRVLVAVDQPEQGAWVDHLELIDDRRLYWSDHCIRLCSLCDLLPTPMNFHNLRLGEARAFTFYSLWPDRFPGAHLC